LSDCFRIVALILCALLIVGCTEVIKATPNEIHAWWRGGAGVSG
jgi:hypothetical protein